MATLGTAQAAKSDHPLYPPGWVDRLVAWIRQSGFPAWACYAGLGLVVYLILTAVTWLEGATPFGTFSLVPSDGAGYAVIYLALMHYLDATAQRAFANFRPFLADLDVVEDEALLYQLTTMPARSTLMAGGAGLAGTAVGLLLLEMNGAGHLTPGLPSQFVLVFLGNFFVATFFYHTVHQLQMVSRIHAAATQVNLFRREPAYAFSRLTARTGASWVVAFTLGAVPRLSLELTALYGPLAWMSHFTAAMLAFVLPLLSMHRLLRAEKRALQAGVNRRLETMLVRLNERIDEDSYADAGELKMALDSMLIERDVITRIPTWPWNVTTLAGTLSAVLLPVAIWLIQQMLSGMFAGN